METQVGWALVIDADTSAHALYRQALSDLGYEVDICDRGASASLAMMRRGYDLIVLNPCVLGIGAIDILRHSYRQPVPIPLVFVGVAAPAEPDPSTFPVVPHGILQKPFTAGQLQEAVEIGLREQRDRPRMGLPAKPGGEGELALLHKQLARLLMVLFEGDRASLMLWGGADHIAVAASAGFPFTVPGSTNAPLKDSVSGWVIRHAEPLLLEPDAELPFDLQSAWRNGAIRSGICAPLLARGQVLGVLAIARRAARAPFIGADLDRLVEQAAGVASLIEQARLNSANQRRAERMTRLNGLAAGLMAAADLEHILTSSIEQVLAIYPEIQGYLFLREAQSPWIDRLLPIGEGLPHPPSLDDLRDQPGLAGQVLADGIPRLRKTVDVAQELASWEQGPSATPQLLCVPLKTETAVYGAIELLGWQQSFDEEDIQFMSTLAGLAALAIERSQQYTAVARQAKRYATMFAHASDAILLVERGRKSIVAANPAAAELSGYSELDLAAIAPARLIAPALMGGRSAVPVADLLAGSVLEYDGYIRTRSGYSVPVSIAVSTLAIDSAEFLLLVVRNMTEAHRQAQQLAQAEKLAGMTRLTASIAHQINNPLQALHNTLHLLLSRSFTEEKRERLLGMAQMEVDRLTVLVRRMLELHRPTNDDMRLVSIHSLLEGVIAGAAPQLQQHHVSIERDWAERLPWVNGIGGHLKQVFQDLVTNAAEAMPNGGRLVVCTRLEEGANGQPPPRVLVEFVDNGPGIPEGETQLIFEPFYTTKGTNTGLGLAISHSIIERHGGTLTVSSGTAGTTFRVVLPVASGTKA